MTSVSERFLKTPYPIVTIHSRYSIDGIAVVFASTCSRTVSIVLSNIHGVLAETKTVGIVFSISITVGDQKGVASR